MTEVKHTLAADGAPFTADGERVGESGTSGVGGAKCSCGWISPALDSRAARKTAHAEHKAGPGTTTVEYTGPLAFVKSLGVAGANVIAENNDLTDVTLNPAPRPPQISFTGGAAEREIAETELTELWGNGLAKFKTWKREGKAARNALRQTPEGRKEMLDQENSFLLEYCATYTEDVL